MSFKKLFLSTSAAALFAGSALADGGPTPEPPPPPPPPAEEEPAPPPPPPPAPEAAPSVWYAAVHGGAVWLGDMELESDGELYGIESETGWAAGGALGYRYGNGLRAEFEGTYRTNDGDFLFFDPLDGPELEGVSETSALNFMLNALYDFDMGGFFSPYLGAGVGAARVDVELSDGAESIDDNSWAFAYQFIGGFSVPMPNTAVEFFADYRYLATAGLELDFDDQVQDNDEYESHTVMGGVRFNF